LIATQTMATDASDGFHFVGLWAVVAGTATLLIVAWILVVSVQQLASTDAVAILGAIASPIVALVSAYFGISVSASAQTKLQNTGDHALTAAKGDI
jgi:hypothetical protein